MPRTRPPYPDEFRERTVGLIRDSHRPIPEVAEELGVSAQTVRNWLRQADIDDGARDGLSSEDKQELARLRRENKRLREEREILKKATAFFAGETR